jgi:hypothetical protein
MPNSVSATSCGIDRESQVSAALHRFGSSLRPWRLRWVTLVCLPYRTARRSRPHLIVVDECASAAPSLIRAALAVAVISFIGDLSFASEGQRNAHGFEAFRITQCIPISMDDAPELLVQKYDDWWCLAECGSESRQA